MARKKKEEPISEDLTKIIQNEEEEAAQEAAEDEEIKSNNTGITKMFPVKKLGKLIKEPNFVQINNRSDIRLVVSLYYQIQNLRIHISNQISAINKPYEDMVKALDSKSDNYEELLSDIKDMQKAEIDRHMLLIYEYSNFKQLEDETKKAIGTYAAAHPVGQWAMQICGMGPVMTAGLLAYLDINKAPSVSHFYQYAGINDNNRPWLKKEGARNVVKEALEELHETKLTDEVLNLIASKSGRKFEQVLKLSYDENDNINKETLIKNLSKPPHNGDLKVLMFKIGESFVKVSNKPKSKYGQIYRARVQYENDKNEKGEYANQAARALQNKNYGKTTEAYKAYINGKLPKAQINMRAKRYAEKIFLSHFYEALYIYTYGKPAPKPYAIQYLGHADYIEPEVSFDSLYEAYRKNHPEE